MQLPRVRFTMRRMMIAVAAVSVLIIFGAMHQTTNLSCHLCHNREVVETSSVCGLPLIWRQHSTTQFPVGSGHIHQWSRYGRRSEGIFIGGVSHACRMRVYEDGSAAPDGYH